MALFVPVLRIALLFLNVYDAYKTLKPPPPSLRDSTRPSVRATTQRKRDMKGCLAVWIIWCCFSTYERVIESIVSLFIPFYDEFKLMFMLFLILTRARGAEPIFLHIIRPLIKPYTTTLDGTLDMLRMIGDFVFALSSYPVHLALEWWYKRTKPSLEYPDFGSETTSSVSRETDSVRASPDHSVHTGEVAQHEIWVPPQAAYESDEELNEAIDSPPEILDLTQEERAVEEWQRYPAFPSAYPATPLVYTSQLASASLAFHPPILEDRAPQGFQRSLLLSRKPLNPSYAVSSSDRTQAFSGIYHVAGTAGASSTAVQTEGDDSISEDEEDEEDVFNMTLRSPLPLHGAARSRLMAKITIPGPMASVVSPSTAIPSAHSNASFRTASLSESSQSPLISPAESLSAAVYLEQTIGRSRVSSRAQKMEGLNAQDVIGKRQKSVRKRKMSRSDLQELTATSDAADDDESEVPSAASGDDIEKEVYVPGEQRPETKRRRVGQTPRKASIRSTKAIQFPRAIRRPLAARQHQQSIKSGQTGKPHAAKAASPAVRRSSRHHGRSAGSANSEPRDGKRVPSSTDNSGGAALASASTSSSTSSLSDTIGRGTNVTWRAGKLKDP